MAAAAGSGSAERVVERSATQAPRLRRSAHTSFEAPLWGPGLLNAELTWI